MKKFGFVPFLFFLFLGVGLVEAQEVTKKTSDAPTTIEIRWDSMWGIKYFKNDMELTGPQLKGLLYSADNPEINTFFQRSEEDENLSLIALGTSLVGSVVCLVIPGTIIHVGSLTISATYLPVQIPAVLLGVVAGFLSNAAGAAKYDAVQRYNGAVAKPEPVTWGLSADHDSVLLNLKYSL
jgi:hypothetical protein